MTFRPNHVLVPVAVGLNDDMGLAEQLVDDACDLLAGAGAAGRLSIVYVNVRQPMVLGDSGLAAQGYLEAMAEVWEGNHKAAVGVLDKLKARAERKGLTVSAAALDAIEGAGEVVARFASERNVDLIVVSSHGRKGLRRLFLGSVAERIAHIATMPVLLIKAPTEEPRRT